MLLVGDPWRLGVRPTGEIVMAGTKPGGLLTLVGLDAAGGFAWDLTPGGLGGDYVSSLAVQGDTIAWTWRSRALRTSAAQSNTGRRGRARLRRRRERAINKGHCS
jgi:hypothetical protein